MYGRPLQSLSNETPFLSSPNIDTLYPSYYRFLPDHLASLAKVNLRRCLCGLAPPVLILYLKALSSALPVVQLRPIPRFPLPRLLNIPNRLPDRGTTLAGSPIDFSMAYHP